MSYSFLPGRRYRMPTHFGPMPGPRQGPAGGRYDCLDDPRQHVVQAAFAAPVDRLERFMPPGFAVARGDLHVAFSYMPEIAWLAGRGSATFGRSEARRGGQEWVRTCRFQWAACH